MKSRPRRSKRPPCVARLLSSKKAEVLSVIVVGEEATVTIDVTFNGQSEQRGLRLVRVDGRWLIRSLG